eukprot:CAMPEP_0116137884 /NCGR_PEP_ID=MMETSP0329-20121206/12479_1 /TAXON_ID=697910 /ORGANISM="Pseudo-nitzschia arenysensis, Strain B593" /LENGTH=468 /DNA_ID=CAMNT_0003632815 /DNA_START=244 /DNA_END=1650 /DNA_ORIENTATION=+
MAGYEVASKSSSVATSQIPAIRGGGGGVDGADNMHVVFSTACSLSHDWQSYLFFFHAMVHNQRGDVTRIVSGCSPEDEIKMKELHEKQFSVMSPNFLIHFTPEYGKQLESEGVSYQKTKYWNKPFGLKHWMEHRFGYVWDDDDSKITIPEYDDHIIVLVDPDMLMQKPFVNDFSKMPTDQWNKYYRKGHEDELIGKVTQGHPAAQDYSFGEKWLTPVKDKLDDIVGPDSPVHDVTTEEARLVFSAGPPYWMTARDAFRISYKWAEFLPGIFKHHPQFMAEMYGYCMASAHLGLRHQMARGMMVSNVDMSGGEGWSFLPKDDMACEVSRYAETVPNVIHFCQRYSIGDFFINKYLFPTDILSCEHPLMELPSKEILKDTWVSHYGDGSIIKWDQSDDNIRRYRHAFMICSLFPAINAAATFYKDQHCDKNDPKTVYDLTYNHFRSDKGKELEEQGKRRRDHEKLMKAGK